MKLLIGFLFYFIILVSFIYTVYYYSSKIKFKKTKKYKRKPSKSQKLIYVFFSLSVSIGISYLIFLFMLLFQKEYIISDSNIMYLSYIKYVYVFIVFFPMGLMLTGLIKNRSIEYVCNYYYDYPGSKYSFLIYGMIQIVLFMFLGPFLLLGTNNYIYLSNDLIVRNTFFQIEEKIYTYDEVDYVTLYTKKVGAGARTSSLHYEVFYEIHFNDGKEHTLRSQYLDKQSVPNIGRVDEIFVSRDVNVNRQDISEQELNSLVKRYDSYEDIIIHLFNNDN